MFNRKLAKIHAQSQPIFIIGVPRSGTTLLRILVDSHPNIVCGPESPWLARGAKSIKDLYDFMANNTLGYVQSYGVPKDVFRRQLALWVDSLFSAYAESRGKQRWAEKTPDHSLEIPFLAELFPEAYFVHIVRDGRDVACSTAILSAERKSISEWHTNNLLLDEGEIVLNTVQNAARRWQIWLNRIELDFKNVRNSYTLRYEDLVRTPEYELRRLMSFVEDDYSPAMLDYMKKKHDYPAWEWGSRDVKNSTEISNRSIRRWEKQLDQNTINELETLIGSTLQRYNYN